MSPLERSLGLLRRRGCLAEKVERPVQVLGRPFFRRDLFKVADIVAIDPHNQGTLFVQVCLAQHKAAAVAKLHTEDIGKNVKAILEAGNRVVVHAWGLRSIVRHAKGVRKTYQLTEEEIT